MAVLLDGQRLTPQTRTERLLQAITFDTVIKSAPVASIAGVPLAIISAKDFMVGYAGYLGIPKEFVKVDPSAAIVPFSIIAVLLLLGLLMLHDADQFGLAEVFKSLGRGVRLVFFLSAISLYARWVLSGQEDVRLLIATAIMLYVLLWWLPRLISLILRQLRRVSGWMKRLVLWEGRKRGRGAGWYERRGTLLPSKTVGKLVVTALVLAGVLTVPELLGTWTAMTDSDFAMIDRGKDHDEAILGVYGDKAFLGWIEDDVVVEVEMVAVSDLEGKPIWTEEIGPLSYDPLYLVE
jgi:hypothetical protein